MSRRTQVVCDGCGKTKERANHWWTVTPVITIGGAFSVQQICIAPYSEQHEPGVTKDFCGQDCVLKFISEQMGKAQG